jgi:hypothetical protein
LNLMFSALQCPQELEVVRAEEVHAPHGAVLFVPPRGGDLPPARAVPASDPATG